MKQTTRVYWRKNIGQVITLLPPSDYVMTNQGITFKFVMKRGEVIDIYTSVGKNTWTRSMILINRAYKANEEIPYVINRKSKAK